MRKLKGVCRIELTDVKTGEKKVTVDENVVTDSIAQLFSLPQKYAIAKINTRLSIFPTLTPAHGCFSGVVLLNNAISGTDTELKAKTAFPVGSAVTAHAGSNTSLPADDLTCGVWNSEESGDVENGYKYVWDFPTDRANGDIACVCLTAASGGNYTPVSDTYRSTSAYNLFANYSDTSTTIYFSSSSDALRLRPIGIIGDKFLCVSANTTAETIYTVELDPQITLFNSLWGVSRNPGTDESRYEAHALDTGIAGRLARYCDGYIFQVSGTTLKKIDPETFEQVGSAVTLPVTPIYAQSTYKSWWVKDNYVYVIPSSNRKTVQKINLADTSDATTLSLPQSAKDLAHIWGEINGKILVGTFDKSYVESSSSYTEEYFIEGAELAKTRYSGATSSSGTSHITDLITIPNNNMYYLQIVEGTSDVTILLWRHRLYAATIDNLQTPVTKTNATTMKIIYTITDAEEEEEEEPEVE